MFTLEKWDLAYAKNIAKHANNKKIWNNLRDAMPSPYTYDDAVWYINDCTEKEGACQLTRAIVVDGEAVGSVGVFQGSDVYKKSAEIGYWLSEEFWGKGIMTEAVKQMCELAFANFDIVRIHAEIFEYNIGSRRVLEKAGFAFEGIKRASVFKNGNIYGSRVYALIRE